MRFSATAVDPALNPQHEDHETALESLASICAVLAVGLFVMTFVFQNYEIPSASMENTLLIGDHVLVDYVTLAPPTRWFPSSATATSSAAISSSSSSPIPSRPTSTS